MNIATQAIYFQRFDATTSAVFSTFVTRYKLNNDE